MPGLRQQVLNLDLPANHNDSRVKFVVYNEAMQGGGYPASTARKATRRGSRDARHGSAHNSAHEPSAERRLPCFSSRWPMCAPAQTANGSHAGCTGPTPRTETDSRILAANRQSEADIHSRGRRHRLGHGGNVGVGRRLFLQRRPRVHRRAGSGDRQEDAVVTPLLARGSIQWRRRGASVLSKTILSRVSAAGRQLRNPPRPHVPGLASADVRTFVTPAPPIPPHPGVAGAFLWVSCTS